MAALSLSMTRDKTAVFYLTVVEYDGVTPQNLTGSTLYFHAATSQGFYINKNSPSDGIVVTDATGGLATLTIDPADTTDLAENGNYAMPCELTLVNGGATYELNRGTLRVLPNVGTP